MVSHTANTPRIEEYDWGRMEWLADQTSHPNTETSLAKMIVNPGADTPLHMHDNCSELLHLLSGVVALHMRADDPLEMQAGDSQHIPKYTPHHVRNTGTEHAVLILSYSVPNRRYLPLEQVSKS